MQYGSWLGWQIDYLLYLQSFRDLSHHVFDNFFITITMFGEVMIPISVICLLYWALNKRAGQFIMFSYMFGFITNIILKTIACIYRPWILDSRIHPVPQALPAATGYSFPSGHTAGATSTWGGLAVYFWQNKIVRYMGIIILLCVMVSRNYLGVHTPQDVIVSFFVGIFLLWFIGKLMKWEEQKEGRDLKILLAVMVIVALTVVFVAVRHYPIHYLFGKILYDPSSLKVDALWKASCMLGAFIGWFIEKRYIQFDAEKGSFVKKTIRVVLGITILSALHSAEAPLQILPIHHLGLAIQYFIIGLFVTGLYPLMIKKWNL